MTKALGVFIFTAVFVLSPISFLNIIALSQSVPIEEITGYQEWNQSRTIDKDVIVGPDATLVIGKGVEISFTNPWIGIQVEGNLFIKGTVKEPTIIKTDLIEGGFSITAQTGSSVMIRNAEILNGGSEAYLIGRVMNVAFANSYKGAVQVNGGNVDIQNTTFRNNLYAVLVGSPDAIVRVNRSRFIENNFDVEADGNKVDFQYNWWGVADGPQQRCFTYGNNQQYCSYEKIYGNFNFSNWLTQETFRDPVLIVPGILGSQEKHNQWTIDPVYHTYDNLYEAFVDDGYVPERDIFVFPYNWRDSNIENAKLLQKKIDEIKVLNHWPKVDVVAHSMGGLLVREYVESGYYGNDIDQLITVATPQLGAPEAYIKWDGAEWFLSPLDLYMKHIIAQEAYENGFSDIFDYIHNRPMTSLQELLPVYDYLYDIDENEALRQYPDNYPKNEFLENLNNRSENLHKVEFDKIIGNLGNDSSTISGFNVINVDMGKYWINGYLPGFEVLSERGIRYSNGDSTVPLYSSKSENLKSDYLIELSSDHRSIVTDAQKDVLELLTGNRPQEEVRNSLIHRMLFVSVFSPVDIQIIAPDGSRVGKNFVTGGVYDGIPGAYYTGYDTKNEFITIPNPEKGEYRILTQGTDMGTYRVEVSHIQEDENGTASESTATIAGTAEFAQETESSVEIQTTGEVVLKNQDITPPVTTFTHSGTQGTNDWYTSDVTVTLFAQDETNGTGVAKTEYSLDNGTTWNVYANPFVLANEGTSTIQYFSTDKSENTEDVKTKTIKIDKTAPEAKIVFNPDTQKLEIIGIDTLGQSVSVVNIESVIRDETRPVSQEHHWYDRFDWNQKNREKENDKEKKGITTTLTDQSGHTTVIVSEEKENEKNHLKRTLRSLSYDGISVEMKDVEMQYEWQEDWRGRYMKIDAQLRIPTMNLESEYLFKKNETWITKELRESENEDRENDTEKHETKERFTGMIVPGFLTKSGIMNIVY